MLANCPPPTYVAYQQQDEILKDNNEIKNCLLNGVLEQYFVISKDFDAQKLLIEDLVMQRRQKLEKEYNEQLKKLQDELETSFRKIEKERHRQFELYSKHVLSIRYHQLDAQNQKKKIEFNFFWKLLGY